MIGNVMKSPKKEHTQVSEATNVTPVKPPRRPRGSGPARAPAKPRKVFIVATLVDETGAPLSGLGKANINIHGFFKSAEDAIETMEANPGSVYLRGEVPPGR